MTDDTNVREMASHVDLDLDQQPTDPRDSYPPFRVRIGGNTFALDAPDAGLVMELEEARTSRVFMALAFDAQWSEVEPLLLEKSPEVLVTLVRQYGEHFDLDQAAILAKTAPNRAERRQRRRRGR